VSASIQRQPTIQPQPRIQRQARIQRQLSFESLALDKSGLAGLTGNANAGHSPVVQAVQHLASLPLPLAERCLTISSIWQPSKPSQKLDPAFLSGVGMGCGKNKAIVDGIKGRLIDKAGYSSGDLGMSRKTRFQRFFDMLRGSGAVGRYQRSLDRSLHKCDIKILKLMASETVSLSADSRDDAPDSIQAINPHRQQFKSVSYTHLTLPTTYC
jgi:hypothetical protein